MALVIVPQVSDRAIAYGGQLAKAEHREVHGKLGWYRGRVNPFRPFAHYLRRDERGFLMHVRTVRAVHANEESVPR